MTTLYCRAALLIMTTLITACASQPSAPISALAPLVALRAAINFGNPILATKDATTGEARGVDVDLAREPGRRQGVSSAPRSRWRQAPAC